MEVHGKELASKYAAMGDEELIALGRAYATLTEFAQDALRAEFARRGLETPDRDEAPDPDGPGRLVTVRRYRDLSEAIVARSLLESAGIPVYLYDENLVRLDWQISNFLGGMRLQVEATDVAAALELLAQPVPETIAYGGATYVQPRCPQCGSTETTFEGAARGAQLASLYVIGIPLPAGEKTWQCEACGAQWEDVAEEEPLGDEEDGSV